MWVRIFIDLLSYLGSLLFKFNNNNNNNNNKKQKTDQLKYLRGGRGYRNFLEQK